LHDGDICTLSILQRIERVCSSIYEVDHLLASPQLRTASQVCNPLVGILPGLLFYTCYPHVCHLLSPFIFLCCRVSIAKGIIIVGFSYSTNGIGEGPAPKPMGVALGVGAGTYLPNNFPGQLMDVVASLFPYAI
jgi:hypothetical protein